MSVLLLSSLCFCAILVLPAVAAPLSLGLVVIVLSVGFCLVVGAAFSSWYGYILFLIYVGGLLVMFVYVSAISPNNIFSSSELVVLGMASLCGALMFVYLLGTEFSGKVGGDMEFLVEGGVYDSFSGDLLVGPMVAVMLVVLGGVLLVNLVAVVKICVSRRGGALRGHVDISVGE
uniref:NADH-ubiquinone oxidoreductase chain 6 n=1 Tax=Diodora graeca TaxID=120387 RepID=A0A0X9Q1S0_DIOGA|nr:NADH dehydrogenase subunit 6 [Diodora graeca]